MDRGHRIKEWFGLEGASKDILSLDDLCERCPCILAPNSIQFDLEHLLQSSPSNLYHSNLMAKIMY